ncbi:MAG: type VI secretion system tube protein Hcp [Sandaracinaceae bacterium]|nr:type VI secretion system tube protein Hcp [Sandaracinaceae bacterium]
MAQSVHLSLKSAGQDIQGDSTILSLGRENTIECIYFSDAVRTAREKSSGMATGDRTYEPLKILKRIDKSSPLLAKALCNNEMIEGTFRFFRPSPTGDGTTQQFFTVEISEGRIAGILRESPTSSTRLGHRASHRGGHVRVRPHPLGVRGRRHRARGPL